jgi:oxepin-CoA hydrolase/3-oxo-5,6-dehydrosuberyl-CoA semialdehyde dehydrogenase
MKTQTLLNYARDRWYEAPSGLADVQSAITGETIAVTGSGGLDFAGMMHHARTVGGPALRKLTFHERAHMLKALGLAVMARKEELYELNYETGATRTDGWIDIEGGAGRSSPFRQRGGASCPTAGY